MRFGLVVVSTAVAAWMALGANAFAQGTPASLQAQIEAARAAEHDHSYYDAVRLWTPLAEQGVAEAQAHLGQLYAQGQGVCKSQAKAVEWLKKAADQGFVEAFDDLGDLYSNGTGSFKDGGRALAWYQKAADLGDARAEEALASIYAQGEGVPVNRELSYTWLKKAVEQRRKDGDLRTASLDAFFLGAAYADDKDDVNAAAWYLIAANMGSLEAMDELAPMYEKGVGVPRDYVQAYKWYALLAAYDKAAGLRVGYATEVKALKRLSAKMNAAQLQQARVLVQESKIVPIGAPPPVLTPVVRPPNCPAE